MFKSVSSESTEGHESHKMSGKRGAEDEGDEFWEDSEGSAAVNSTTLTTVSAPAATDQFMHTPEFRIHFVEFAHVQTLMALRCATKSWNAVADALIDEGVGSGAMIVHDGKDMSYRVAHAREKKRNRATLVIFPLNITNVEDHACCAAFYLVAVDTPEGVEWIGYRAFYNCESLITISFPTMLMSIGYYAFGWFSILETVDLLHTNLHKLSTQAFGYCSELKSMTIPDELQRGGADIFIDCFKLIPDNIDVSGYSKSGATSEVIAHLRSQQQQEYRYLF